MTRCANHWLRTITSALLVATLAGCGGDDDDGTASPSVATAVANDDAVSVDWNVASTLAVTANDTVRNGSAVVTIKANPSHGTATVEGGAIRYTPEAGYFGPDLLSYTLVVGDQTADAEVKVAVAAELTLTGSVRDNPLPGASVTATATATAGATALGTAAADADGNYRLVFKTADPDAFVALRASGVDARAHVVLTSLLGGMREAVTAATAGTLSAAALPAANITHISTAIAVLTEQALGRPAASSADLASAQGKFTATQTVEMATVIKLVADAGVAFPAGSADTLALVSAPDVYKSFVISQSVANAELFSQTRQAVLGDPAVAVALLAPAADGASTTILLVQGEGASANPAIRLVLTAGGMARVEADAVRSAQWTSNGSEIVVT